jgi:hypothetical protein
MSVEVFFFGGYLASPNDMKRWVASAKALQPNIAFNAFHWYEKDKEKKAVAAIKASTADTIYVVGHSSGCANANAVEKSLAADKSFEDASKLELVALDGFAPNAAQRKRTRTQIWSAVNGTHKAKNYDDLKNLLGKDLLEYQALPDCTTRWALHFSLVNANASDSVVKAGHHLATGYDQCKANLCWLVTLLRGLDLRLIRMRF